MSPDSLKLLVRSLRTGPLCSSTGPAPADLVTGLLPHRTPMLLLDRLTAIEPDFASLRAERWLDPDDSVFAGHFPGEPVYPGVLLVEMIGQAALCLYGMRQRQAGQGPQQQIRATRIHHAAFHAAALPGAKLDIHAHIAEDRGITTVFAGQVWSAETLCATAVGECLNVSG